MIKNFFSSKITATASPECVVIGLKMLDSEAHALRLVGLVLLAASVAILVCEWRKKTTVEAVAIVSAPASTKSSHKHSRSRASRRH